MQQDLGRLLDRAGHGDREAFASFYDLTAPTALRLARAAVHPLTDAEDVLLRAYAQAWTQAPTHPWAGRTPMAWLMWLVQDAAPKRPAT